MSIPKHFSIADIDRLLDNCDQENRYLDYYWEKAGYWSNVAVAETDPLWMEVAYQNLLLITERLNHLLDMLA